MTICSTHGEIQEDVLFFFYCITCENRIVNNENKMLFKCFTLGAFVYITM